MNVSAIIVTRGDVDLHPCWETIPAEWEKIVWSNAMGWARVEPLAGKWWGELHPVPDLSVYGRYAAIEHATGDLIYVQDDDVIVSDPDEIVDVYCEASLASDDFGMIVANMPQEFRPYYEDSCLVGFGACFHRDVPARAFARFGDYVGYDGEHPFLHDPSRLRTCDVVFTTLTPRVLVDVPKTNREFAEDADRMYRQPEHVGERARMLDLARKARDA